MSDTMQLTIHLGLIMPSSLLGSPATTTLRSGGRRTGKDRESPGEVSLPELRRRKQAKQNGFEQEGGTDPMSTGTITTRDGTTIFYKDWGTGQPVVFSHGWPLNADAWDDQLFYVASQGYRAIAHDRRGHGRSSQPWDGNDMDHYADDLAALLEALDLRDAVLVGHSTGGGEVAHYIGRHGTSRLAKAVLVGAVPPLMLRTTSNPGGLPIETFDGFRASVIGDRSQYYKDLSVPFYGANRPGSKVSQGILEMFWLWSASSRPTTASRPSPRPSRPKTSSASTSPP
jgi:pimeloyl-ACP methyl ester carboxylesterase